MAGRPLSETRVDPAGASVTHSWTWTGDGQVGSVDGATVAWDRDGNRTGYKGGQTDYQADDSIRPSSTVAYDALGNQTKNPCGTAVYDGLDRTTTNVNNGDSAAKCGAAQTETVGYDGLGRQTTLASTTGRTDTYRYADTSQIDTISAAKDIASGDKHKAREKLKRIAKRNVNTAKGLATEAVKLGRMSNPALEAAHITDQAREKGLKNALMDAAYERGKLAPVVALILLTDGAGATALPEEAALTELSAAARLTDLATDSALADGAELGSLGAESGGAAAAEARGGVYSLRNEAGDVVRTGRSSDLAAREVAHFNDPVLGEYRFQAEYRTDVYAEQRGLEQTLYDRHPGAQSANGGFNKIRGISPSNPKAADIRAGRPRLPREPGLMMAKVSYREGDWFAVPLRDGGFATGVVARANPKAALLGYFFGPKRDDLPSFDDLAELKPGDAVLVGKFGNLGLVQGKWPLLGRLEDWDRAEWSMPVFVRYEELTGRSFRVFYDEDDPSRLIGEEQVAPGTDEQGPRDGLMGAGFAEKMLTTLLR